MIIANAMKQTIDNEMIATLKIFKELILKD